MYMYYVCSSMYPLPLSITGLFEAHKLLFSFQMAMKIQEVESTLNREELNFFIKGNMSLEKVCTSSPNIGLNYYYNVHSLS